MTETALRLNPFPWFRQMRQQTPIIRQEYFGTQRWSVFRYADVERVLSDHTTFSSANPGSELSASIVRMDPPRHRQLRTLISQAFTPRAIANMEGRIAKIVHQLLDRVEDQGRMDVVEDFAYPLPAMVITEMLGVPYEDRATFRHWSNQIVAGVRVDPETGKSPYIAMKEFFSVLIAERERERQNDLISALLATQADGKSLTEAELLDFCNLLLIAGNESTTLLLTNAIHILDEHPEVMEELQTHPALIPLALEEVLRYRSPVCFMIRRVTQEVAIAGKVLQPGEGVLAWIASANRDEVQFSDPDTFDIHRTPNKHLAFGHGIHFCLGAPLARLEAQVALTILLERWCDIKRADQEPLEPVHSEILLGPKHLPITFCKR